MVVDQFKFLKISKGEKNIILLQTEWKHYSNNLA